MKYIFVVGGVMSGVGKGVAVSSIAKLLQSRGFRTTTIKIDPYVNVDAGTMNPTEHGEIFVLNDGAECDQDMGNYERFLNCNLSGDNYMTLGSIFKTIIEEERNLKYEGRCVEVVPHIPLKIIEKIKNAGLKNKAEIVITEIGGTVGEYQNILFLEAIRILKIKQPNDVLLLLVSYLPLQNFDSELKTKPTQYAVRTLNSTGLQPDIIIARAVISLDKKRKEKIAFNCSLNEEDIISAPDIKSIYEVPLNFEKDNLSALILKKLKLRPRQSNLQDWRRLIDIIHNSSQPVKIGVVGKYFSTGKFVLADAYISVIEAVKHAAYYFRRKPEISWIDSEIFEQSLNQLKNLKKYEGIIVPGGFGKRGTEGKIKVINFCRKQKIPFLGLCYGMQLAVIEFGRSAANLKKANSSEIDPQTPYPVIDILPEQKKILQTNNYGATMRLGSYPTVVKTKTISHNLYHNSSLLVKNKEIIANDLRFANSDLLISERHRHRYEVNPEYIKHLSNKGLVFSGFSPNGKLMEIMELPQKVHPFFVATQFHPEFQSRPLSPHPLFKEFIKTSIR